MALMRDPPENSRVITIVPAMADWLITTFNVEGAQGNRKEKKPKRIERYSDSMKDGTWLLTGEPLIFGKQKLLDGQNRLMGCVRSDEVSDCETLPKIRASSPSCQQWPTG